jgi:hypothetical protein
MTQWRQLYLFELQLYLVKRKLFRRDLVQAGHLFLPFKPPYKFQWFCTTRDCPTAFMASRLTIYRIQISNSDPDPHFSKLFFRIVPISLQLYKEGLLLENKQAFYGGACMSIGSDGARSPAGILPPAAACWISASRKNSLPALYRHRRNNGVGPFDPLHHFKPTLLPCILLLHIRT